MLVCAAALLALTAPPASAHVVPTSTVQLDVYEGRVNALVSIPVSDMEAASGLDLAGGTQTAVDAASVELSAYLKQHVTPTADDGQPWTVDVGPLTVNRAGDPATTGLYQQLQTTLTITPPTGVDERSFNLGYTAIVDRVATHVIIVTVHSDWANGDLQDPYQIGVVERDTVTNGVQALHINLGSGSSYRGFLSMVSLGMRHIAEGTDHQLFLLTLLLPAPLVARSRRWGGVVAPVTAIRRIGSITLAFTLGHSTTLALGALGVPVPQHLVEAMIAVSILVAAVHALRPLFAGREAIVAGAFGLVHGLAFSEVLRALHLTDLRLVLSLLGFNLGIEAMQLIVVALVLPPLIVLAQRNRYHLLRLLAASAAGIAAVGWLLARVGIDNPVATVADHIGVITIPTIVLLWLVGIALLLSGRRQQLSVEADYGMPRSTM